MRDSLHRSFNVCDHFLNTPPCWSNPLRCQLMHLSAPSAALSCPPRRNHHCRTWLSIAAQRPGTRRRSNIGRSPAHASKQWQQGIRAAAVAVAGCVGPTPHACLSCGRGARAGARADGRAVGRVCVRVCGRGGRGGRGAAYSKRVTTVTATIVPSPACPNPHPRVTVSTASPTIHPPTHPTTHPPNGLRAHPPRPPSPPLPNPRPPSTNTLIRTSPLVAASWHRACPSPWRRCPAPGCCDPAQKHTHLPAAPSWNQSTITQLLARCTTTGSPHEGYSSEASLPAALLAAGRQGLLLTKREHATCLAGQANSLLWRQSTIMLGVQPQPQPCVPPRNQCSIVSGPAGERSSPQRSPQQRSERVEDVCARIQRCRTLVDGHACAAETQQRTTVISSLHACVHFRRQRRSATF